MTCPDIRILPKRTTLNRGFEKIFDEAACDSLDAIKTFSDCGGARLAVKVLFLVRRRNRSAGSRNGKRQEAKNGGKPWLVTSLLGLPQPENRPRWIPNEAKPSHARHFRHVL